ncbi:MAG: class I SAM-dependent methyltransferase, partial [Alphaproteobacteria bacterium]|nr:class I SAM-dependent methyltransferase [Alphaproteobacteria bacterium]
RTNWRPKQNSIYEILKKYKPTTVVDIGCNTGWFSILAEHLGAKVISIDADEACVDDLYSKEHKLNILPLKINFEDLDKKYFCKPIKKEFYSAPILRLKSELTLCLALVHHLVLAYGMSIEKVMNILARITNKVLVVEIPNLQDPLIRGNLPYYRYAEDATSDRYSVDRFIEEGWKYFKKIEIYQSHPRTRKIIVFEK